jgi:hypothetical protein
MHPEMKISIDHFPMPLWYGVSYRTWASRTRAIAFACHSVMRGKSCTWCIANSLRVTVPASNGRPMHAFMRSSSYLTYLSAACSCKIWNLQEQEDGHVATQRKRRQRSKASPCWHTPLSPSVGLNPGHANDQQHCIWGWLLRRAPCLC